jgi:hypothetical protein
MKTRNLSLVSALAFAWVSFSVNSHAQCVALPVDAAITAPTASPLGFTVRTLQGPADIPLDNTYLRALRQINGTLLDTEGNPVPNEAIPGPGADGS